jgi:RHS repeat-associated protein
MPSHLNQTMHSWLFKALVGSNLLLAGAIHAQEVRIDYEYDTVDNRTKVTNGLNHSTQTQYDPLSRIKQLQQTAPVPGGARPTTDFTFDAANQIKTVTDPRRLSTTYTVDGLGKQTRLVSPDTGLTKATHDSLGNITSSTDARGVVSTYQYDAKNRLTSISHTGAKAPYQFVYDQGLYGKGRLSKMTYPGGQTEFTWDQLGRLLNKRQSLTQGASTRVLSYSYTYVKKGYGAGLMASHTFPSGNRIDYGYDEGGRLNSLTLQPVDGGNPVPLVSHIGYQPFGPVNSWVWGNSSETQRNSYARTFDLAGRLIGYPLGNAFNQGVMRSLSYDAASRIKQFTDTGLLDNRQSVQTFDYDDLDRLIRYSNGANTWAYQYDQTGNRTQVTVNGVVQANTIDPASNRLRSVTVGNYVAPIRTDAAGNQQSNGTGPVFTYGPTGRIESVIDINTYTGVSYYYNSMGERLNTGNSYYMFDQGGRLMGEYDLDGKAIEETVYLGDQPIVVLKPPAAPVGNPDQVDLGTDTGLDFGTTDKTSGQVGASAAVGTEVFYVYADHLGTPRWIARASDNKVVWRWETAEAFGNSLPNDNPSGLGTFVYNRRFPGQIWDATLEVNYNYFRDYDPRTGRYLQSDPIGLEGGVNTYAYVLSNPVSYTDPTGEVAFIPIIIGAGIGLGIDYAISEWKKKHCTCKDAGTPLGAAGNAGLGAANGLFGPFGTKPRTGIAGGGLAGNSTSPFSQINHAAYQRGAYSAVTRNGIRDFGRAVSKRIPYVSTAITAYELYDAFSCD